MHFGKYCGIAAALPMINIDTDMIVPKNFMKTVKKTGLGPALFAERRYLEGGEEAPEFPLNHAVFRTAKILVTGMNFGCGSSREHAAWALKEFGIECIIAPSFADIFYNNAIRNGLLPICLPEQRVKRIIAFIMELPGASLKADLQDQTVEGPDGRVDAFEIDAFSRRCLMEGLDEIALTLEREGLIYQYERYLTKERPWL